MSVRVCCMFYVSQKTHIKWSQNGIKRTENIFGIFMIFGSWNHRKRRPTQPTRHQGALEAPGAGGGLCPPRTLVGALLRVQGSLYPEKNHVQISAQSEIWISGNIRNGFRPDPRRETEGNREGDPISEGLPPLRRHEGHGPEGDPSSHLGGEAKEAEEGGALSPLSRGRRNAAGARIVTAIYINNLATVNTNFLPLYAAV